MTVPTHTAARSARPVCRRRRHALLSRARMLVAALALAVAFGGVGAFGMDATSAWADEAPAPMSTPSATAPPEANLAPATVTIDSHADGDFLRNNAATVSGKKSAGSRVVVTAGGGSFCSAPVTDPASTDWGCSGTLPNGADLELTATEVLDDDRSEEHTSELQSRPHL